MNKPRNNVLCLSLFFFLILGLVFVSVPARADIELKAGVAGMMDEDLDTEAVTSENFYEFFTDNGPFTPSHTIDTWDSAIIGTMWTSGEDSGEGRYVRTAIDSNNDGTFTPIDWDDPGHPWNRPDNGTPDDESDDPVSWEYTYPSDYPDETLRGTIVALTWDPEEEIVLGFPEYTFEWFWYESRYDYSELWWVEESDLMTVYWFGRDEDWNMLPNGTYAVDVRLDEDGDYQFSEDEIHKSLMIEIMTASISGIVLDENGNPVRDANIEAYSYYAWGDATTNALGEFTVTGLGSDDSYTLYVTAPGKLPVEVYGIGIAAVETEKYAGEIVMEDAIFISGTIKLDRNVNGATDEEADKFVPFVNQYGWETNPLEITIEAWNTDGSGWGGTMAEIYSGGSSADFSIPIPKGDNAPYEIGVYCEGFAAEPMRVNVTENGGNAGVIVLAKASILKGSIRLPKPVTNWTSIDVQAVSVSNEDERYWGWGEIDPYHVPGHCSDSAYDNYDDCVAEGGTWTEWLEEPQPLDTGTFQFDGVPAGVYDVSINIMGYRLKVLEDVEILKGEDKDLGEILMERGSVISGTLTIQGNTAGVTLNEWDDGVSDMYVWIDAWNPETGEWSGADVTVERGENMSAAYEIGGLDNGRYEIGAEMEGYELTGGDGTVPVFADLANTAEVNLVLKPHEGVLTGIISGDGVTLDFSKTVVQVMRPWDWLPPRLATVENGGIDPATGRYTVTGLGTDDYIVRAGMAANLSEYGTTDILLAEPGAGVFTESVFVENDAANPTVLDIAIPKGYSVSGTVSLNASDPPWHDFGNGSGGKPNGAKDTSGDMYDERITISDDLLDQMVEAVPVDMVFMTGDQDAYPLAGHIRDNGDGTASYRIDGLSPGAYEIIPPFLSPRVTNMFQFAMADTLTLNEPSHHWVVESKPVVIDDEDITMNFVLGNGHTLTGRLTLPEPQTLDEAQKATMELMELMYSWGLMDETSVNQLLTEFFVGYLALFTPEYEFLGHELYLLKTDFNNAAWYEFKFDHVANGDYLLYFWTERYVSSSVRISVKNANASVNLSVEKGVDLTGRLVDAETGEPVTSEDGVTVMCEAVPWVEGSYRETGDYAWTANYIEDGSASSSDSSSKPNNTPGKFHLTALPTGHQYILVVLAEHGRKTEGAKNYVSRVLAGIDVPEGATGEINLGTIELREGITITGRLTDSNGEPVPGVSIAAIPTDDHDGVWESWGESDDEGYYTIYGINPDVPYYDLIAAQRPWLFDDWGREIEWGEERRYNVRPSEIDPATGRTLKADFVMARATASLRGTIAIPDSAEFTLPFESYTGDSYPSAYILLQEKGVAYREMLDGIEGITEPVPGNVKTAEFWIDNIAPGTYKIIFMNYGLPRAEIDNITFEEGEEKVLNAAWDDDFYRISGGLALSSGGGHPTSTDISGVVCMNLKERSVIFGRLSREADGTFSSYDVPGLAGSDTFQLIFYNDSGIDDTPEVFAVGEPFTPGYANKNYDAVIARDPEPVLILRAKPDENDAEAVSIGIFSTSYLTDNEIEIAQTEPTLDTAAGKIYLKSGNGALENVTFGDNKRKILATYRKSADDDQIEIMACVHYGKNAATKLETLSFDANADALNSDRVSPYVSDQVTLGSGDNTRIYIPSGAMETSEGDNLTVTIEKTGAEKAKRSKGARSVPDLPAGITLVSDVYEVTAKESGADKTPEYKGLMTVQLEYDPEMAGDAEINVFRNNNGSWLKETENRSVDTDNATISVEVDGLSTFIVGVGELEVAEEGGYSATEVGEGDSSECFIGSARAGSANAWGIAVVACLFAIGLIFKAYERGARR